MADLWTIRSVVSWTADDFAKRGIESARLDAELLIAKALGIDRVGLYLDLDRPLGREERDAVRELIARRREREPVAYILKHKDFFGRRFTVDSSVLVPRPDTEVLVERALELMPQEAEVTVLDVGTGSGAIAVTLAAERPQANVHATDASAAALNVARSNAKALGVAERIEFVEGDLFAGLPPGLRYDVIVSNPPYIPDVDVASLQPEIAKYEPREALLGGEDGLGFFRRILQEAGKWSQEGAHLLFEVGESQAEAVRALGDAAGWQWQATHLDLNGTPRVVHFRPQLRR